MNKHFLTLTIASLFLISACSSDKVETESGANYPQTRGNQVVYSKDKQESIFGEEGLGLFKDGVPEENTGGGLPVNKYLWRASLETLSFMPLASADPFGGVILTDWYQPEGKQGERLKTQVFINSSALKASSIKARVFRQVKEDGNWIDRDVADKTNRAMEDAILKKARQIRLSEEEL